MRYSEWKDYLLLVGGIILALINGALMPLNSVVFEEHLSPYLMRASCTLHQKKVPESCNETRYGVVRFTTDRSTHNENEQLRESIESGSKAWHTDGIYDGHFWSCASCTYVWLYGSSILAIDAIKIVYMKYHLNSCGVKMNNLNPNRL
uniref:DUF2757 family protein n=1 Tax=Heterorhabditis bacteriophora TaxID=37862 RepID=A0A1I7X0T4_HETBA